MSVFGDLARAVWDVEAMLKQTLGVAALKKIDKGQHLKALSAHASSMVERLERAIEDEFFPITMYSCLWRLIFTLNSIALFLKRHSKCSRLRRMFWDALTVPRFVERVSRELEDAARKLVMVALPAIADDHCIMCGKTPALSERGPRLIEPERPAEQHSRAVTGSASFVFPFIFNGRPVQINAPTMDAFAQGASGKIVRAIIEATPTTENVVLKVLHCATAPEESELLRREVEIWSKLNHARILPYYGTCHVGLGQPALVSPFMEHGNLTKYLMMNQDADRLALVKQVAEALEYLHDVVRIVHGDIKCENVLITKEGSALLSDFGLSTFVDAGPNVTATEIRMRNTVRFAAPELLLDAANDEGSPQSRSKTTASDVYAFGMLVYQAYTGLPPWRHVTNTALHLKIVNSELPERPEDVPLFSDTLWEICNRCWSLEPHARPLIGGVRESLSLAEERISMSPPRTGVNGGGLPVEEDR